MPFSELLCHQRGPYAQEQGEKEASGKASGNDRDPDRRKADGALSPCASGHEGDKNASGKGVDEATEGAGLGKALRQEKPPALRV